MMTYPAMTNRAAAFWDAAEFPRTTGPAHFCHTPTAN